jgi:hypothetical protein
MFWAFLLGGMTAFYAVHDQWLWSGLYLGVFVVWCGLVITREPSDG